MKTNRKVYLEYYNDGQAPIAYDIYATKQETNNQQIIMKHWKFDPSINNSFRGKKILTLNDDGNNVEIKFKGGDTYEFNYNEISELYSLLRYYNEDSGLNQFNISLIKFEPCNVEIP